MKLRDGIVATLLVVGCAAPAASHANVPTAAVAPGATSTTHLSEQQAIERSRDHVTMSDLVGATSGRYADLRAITADRSIADDQFVWAVEFTGDIEICPPSGASCLPRRLATSTVFLDYYSGAFLGTSTVSPN